MEKLYFFFFTVALLIGWNREATAQAHVTAHATAEVIEALTATETAQLNFGKFSPETSGGEVKVTPQGVRQSSGSVVLSTGLHNAANFYITGQYEATLTINLPSGPVILTNVATNKSMEVYNWESYPAAGLKSGVLTNGSMIVNVGATLKVGNMIDNPVGIYAGTYAVTFAYN